MKIKAQTCMVLNLDKCLGCQTCTVTCKNVWTSRRGLEYAWFNNVETKPGAGYPTQWESQERYSGGWTLDKTDGNTETKHPGGDKESEGRLRLRQGSKARELTGIFANPHMPSMKDYYEPFTFNYDTLQKGKYRTAPSARPYSIVTGRRMEKIEHGPNWEDDLGGTFARRSADPSLKGIDTEGLDQLERSFMVYLPRLCEHCLNPACEASCPSGAIYKREVDGAVLINQNRCRGWRMCVSACPFKKIYFNTERRRSEKCTFCYPRTQNGQPTVCSESCPGRIRYIGVMLYDADRVKEAAAVPSERQLYGVQLSLFLDPADPAVISQARADGISEGTLRAAQHSPVYKLMKEWRVALPLHPEWRTLPMQWYIPQFQGFGSSGRKVDATEDTDSPNDNRVPLQYLANMLSAGDPEPVQRALDRLRAMRQMRRAGQVPGAERTQACDLSDRQLQEMYRLLGVADYNDRFVIPTHDRMHDES